MLTLVAETFCLLLYPFVWPHIYIPIVPCNLLNYLQAPMPFIMGIHKSNYTEELKSEINQHEVFIIIIIIIII